VLAAATEATGASRRERAPVVRRPGQRVDELREVTWVLPVPGILDPTGAGAGPIFHPWMDPHPHGLRFHPRVDPHLSENKKNHNRTFLNKVYSNYSNYKMSI